MSILQESFLLNNSQPFNLETGAENRTDLSLIPNPNFGSSAIVVNVTAATIPVMNALLKILTPTGNPVSHQFTNEDGVAIAQELPSGIYQVVVSAPGYITSTPVTINLPVATGGFIAVELTADPRAAENTLYGLVLDQVTGNRLSDATVILTDSSQQTSATTITDTTGEYLLCETPNGTYTLTATKVGYEPSSPLTATVTGGTLSQTNISLVPQVAVGATVQGFIKDLNNNLLAGASVGIYSIVGTAETLVQTTFSNSAGFYLFGNLPAGTYVVKSKIVALI